MLKEFSLITRDQITNLLQKCMTNYLSDVTPAPLNEQYLVNTINQLLGLEKQIAFNREKFRGHLKRIDGIFTKGGKLNSGLLPGSHFFLISNTQDTVSLTGWDQAEFLYGHLYFLIRFYFKMDKEKIRKEFTKLTKEPDDTQKFNEFNNWIKSEIVVAANAFLIKWCYEGLCIGEPARASRWSSPNSYTIQWNERTSLAALLDNSKEELKVLMKDFLISLKQFFLSPDTEYFDTICFPAGFDGHASYLGFIKTEDDKVELFHYNLGPGNNYHDKAITTQQGKACNAIRPYHIATLHLNSLTNEHPCVDYLVAVCQAKYTPEDSALTVIYNSPIDSKPYQLKKETTDIEWHYLELQQVNNCVVENYLAHLYYSFNVKLSSSKLFQWLVKKEIKFSDDEIESYDALNGQKKWELEKKFSTASCFVKKDSEYTSDVIANLLNHLFKHNPNILHFFAISEFNDEACERLLNTLENFMRRIDTAGLIIPLAISTYTQISTYRWVLLYGYRQASQVKFYYFDPYERPIKESLLMCLQKVGYQGTVLNYNLKGFSATMDESGGIAVIEAAVFLSNRKREEISQTLILEDVQKRHCELKRQLTNNSDQSQIYHFNQFYTGSSDFEYLVQEKNFFDKSHFIREILCDPTLVKLIIRPRQFGKTTTLQMLQSFFDIRKKENSTYFKGLKIASEFIITPEGNFKLCMEYQGKFPVIFLTLKDIKANSFKDAKMAVKTLLSSLFDSFFEIIKERISFRDRSVFQKIINKDADKSEVKGSLLLLTKCLAECYKSKIIILIDEYDTPIHASYKGGYYEKMCDFTRNILSPALKDNPFLEMGVITGILRIAKEQLFSGLNNLVVYSFLDDYRYSSYFGFTQEDIKLIFREFDESQLRDLENWYGNYRVGNTTVYNPWSIISFSHQYQLSQLSRLSYQQALAQYWTNSGALTLIEETLNRIEKDQPELFSQIMKDFRQLQFQDRDGVLTHRVNPHTVFADLKTKVEAFWSLLLLSGYLSFREYNPETQIAKIMLPNKELSMFQEKNYPRWLNITQDASVTEPLGLLAKKFEEGMVLSDDKQPSTTHSSQAPSKQGVIQGALPVVIGRLQDENGNIDFASLSNQPTAKDQAPRSSSASILTQFELFSLGDSSTKCGLTPYIDI